MIGTITELATGVLPRIAGMNFHFLTAVTADSSRMSWPLLRWMSTLSLSPSVETWRNSQIWCMPTLN
jgi:hypothetical protein